MLLGPRSPKRIGRLRPSISAPIAQQPRTPEPPGTPPRPPPDPTAPRPYEEPPRPIPIPRPDEPPVIDDPPPKPSWSGYGRLHAYSGRSATWKTQWLGPNSSQRPKYVNRVCARAGAAEFRSDHRGLTQSRSPPHSGFRRLGYGGSSDEQSPCWLGAVLARGGNGYRQPGDCADGRVRRDRLVDPASSVRCAITRHWRAAREGGELGDD